MSNELAVTGAWEGRSPGTQLLPVCRHRPGPELHQLSGQTRETLWGDGRAPCALVIPPPRQRNGLIHSKSTQVAAR